MKDVVENEAVKENKIDKDVLKCYYNICDYYNKNCIIINEFLGVILA